MKSYLDIDILKAKAHIGEIREWKGVKYQKQPDNSWKPLKGQGVKRNNYPRLENKFGQIYTQFKNKPKEAIDFLLKRKQGQIIDAYEREGLGKIDIVWGNDLRGLQHIRKRHFIEQDDFKSLEDMSEKISDILKTGKIGKFYDKGNKVNIYKNNYRVALIREVVYDEEDNFKDKIWILTSYNHDKVIEDKIRKSSTVLDGPDDSNNMDSARHNPFISSIAFSEYKDSLKKSMEQQLGTEYFEKAKKGAPVGTIKEFGGKKYVKTESGWKYYGKKKGSNNEEEFTNKPSKIEEHTSSATNKQLEQAIKDPNQKEEVKKLAKEELKKREGEKSNSDFKKITQTYVKVEDGQIIIKMKGENQYKATKGKFVIESEPNESLSEFKKKVKDKYEGKEVDTKKEPEEVKKLEFSNPIEFFKYQRTRSKMSSTFEKSVIDNFNRKLEKINIDSEEIKNLVKSYVDGNSDSSKILKKYGGLDLDRRILLNDEFMKNGFLPIVNGTLYDNYKNTEYKHFYSVDNIYAEGYNQLYHEEGKSNKENESLQTKQSISLYTGDAYEAVRKYNKNPKEEQDLMHGNIPVSRISRDIENFINNHPIENDLILIRRLKAKSLNSLNNWLQAEEGDIIKDNSFASFSLIPLNFFGSDFQITLLAKRGDKVANVNNSIDEFEYLTQKNSKFKVIAKGFNSVVVELVD